MKQLRGWILTLAGAFVLVEAGLAFDGVRRADFPSIVMHANQTLGNLDKLTPAIQKTLGNISAASKTLAQIGADERNAFSTQQTYYKSLTDHTNIVLEDADDSIRQVNLDVLPRAALVLDGLNGSLRDFSNAAVALQTQTQALEPGIDAFNRSMSELPEIARNTSTATAEASATMSDVRRGVDYEVAQIMKPVNKAKVAVRFVASVLGSFFHI